MLRHLGRHPSHLQRIAQGLCQGLRRTEMRGHLAEFGEWHQCSTQGEAHVERLRAPRPTLRTMGQGEQRLLEGEHRLPDWLSAGRLCCRRPGNRLRPCPRLTAQGVLGQSFYLLRAPVPREPLQGLDNACVQPPPPLLQQAPVGHLMGQGMLEGIVPLGEEARLVEELGRLEMRQATIAPPRAARRWPGAAARAPRCQ